MTTRSALALAFVFGTVIACHRPPTDAAGVRANLSRAGYSVAAAGAPDPRAAPFPTVRSSECFDATRAQTVRICVWTWSGTDLPDSFPLEQFSQDNDAYTESRNALFVVVTPTGGPGEDTPGFRAIRSVWGE